MKTLGEILNAAAQRGGIAADSPELVALLSNSDLARITVPEGLQQALEGLGALNVEAAKQNAELKTYFRKPLLNSVDEKLLELANLFGSEFVAKVKAEANTFEKPALFREAIAALKEGKGKEGDDEDVKAARKQVAELNRKLAEYEQSYVPRQELDSLRSGLEQQLLDNWVLGRFAGQAWSEAIAPEFREVLAKAALEKELAAVGGKVVYDNGKGKLVQSADPTLELYVDHKPASLDSLVSAVMTKNKFIAVSQPRSTTNENAENGLPVPTGTTTNASKSTFGRLLSSSLHDQGVD